MFSLPRTMLAVHAKAWHEKGLLGARVAVFERSMRNKTPGDE
jgi:hypothetical protein